MSFNWNRRSFLKKTGTGTLITIASGMSSFDLLAAGVPDKNKRTGAGTSLLNDFKNPPEEAFPWVFWYWIVAAVSKEGITADLEAMKAAGIGGAHLVSVSGAGSSPQMVPP